MDIILYSTGCPKCKILKKKWEDKIIDYVENDDIETMISLGIEQVPVLSVDNKLFQFAEAVKWVNEL